MSQTCPVEHDRTFGRCGGQLVEGSENWACFEPFGPAGATRLKTDLLGGLGFRDGVEEVEGGRYSLEAWEEVEAGEGTSTGNLASAVASEHVRMHRKK